ncbi:MAG: hypothetical protein IPM37_22885 [Hahellaceae bacterium]|nr:hypothetical protein [Hahellaceae bacterium]
MVQIIKGIHQLFDRFGVKVHRSSSSGGNQGRPATQYSWRCAFVWGTAGERVKAASLRPEWSIGEVDRIKVLAHFAHGQLRKGESRQTGMNRG